MDGNRLHNEEALQKPLRERALFLLRRVFEAFRDFPKHRDPLDACSRSQQEKWHFSFPTFFYAEDCGIITIVQVPILVGMAFFV